MRLAVVDLGSNSFRLVVFTAGEGWWKRTDEIYEPVRLGEGQPVHGELQPEPMRRALSTLELFAHFARGVGMDEEREVDAVATSAIRSASNQAEFLSQVAATSGVRVRVLSDEEEARYGYLAAVNSSSLRDGAVLDLGGGSLQLVEVRDRGAERLKSWPLGAVRMTERFFADGGPASRKALKGLRKHVCSALEESGWDGVGGRLVGIGGTVRNLASAAQHALDLPTFGVQGFTITREVLDELVEQLAAVPASERAKAVPGIKAGRADLILAGAATIQAVLEAGGFEGLEVTEAGLREGVFFERYLAPEGLFDDVRRQSVWNLLRQYEGEHPVHVRHVAELALTMFDDLAAAGLHEGDPAERELLWAAGLLHDIGTSVDYDDHHKHSRYLILNAGLPGWSYREIALIAQIAKYHRKGSPSLDYLAPLGVKGDRERVARCATILRVAEQLERSRDQLVRAAHVDVTNGSVELRLEGGADLSLARWAAQRETELFERVFSKPLTVTAP